MSPGWLIAAVILIIIGIIAIVIGAVMFDSNKTLATTTTTTATGTTWTWGWIAIGIFFLIVGLILAAYSYRSGHAHNVHTDTYTSYPGQVYDTVPPPVPRAYPGYPTGVPMTTGAPVAVYG